MNQYLDWPYLGQVIESRRKRYHCRTGRTQRETVYGLTSHSPEQADAARLLELNRRHLGIETGLHFRRDVTFAEDRCRMKSKTAAEALAIFNNLAIGLIRHAGWTNAAQARRHHDAHFVNALQLILQAPHWLCKSPGRHPDAAQNSGQMLICGPGEDDLIQSALTRLAGISSS